MAAFLNDEALRAQLAPHMTMAAFLRAVSALEGYGFPKPDPLFKGRYMPAVRAWLDAQAGLGKVHAPLAPDGAETWGNDHALEDAGTVATQAQGRRGRALLGRGEPQPEGRGALPRPVDPFTARRHARGS